jgi:hypothetical protein
VAGDARPSDRVKLHNSDVAADVALAALGTTQLNTSRYADSFTGLTGCLHAVAPLEARHGRPKDGVVPTGVFGSKPVLREPALHGAPTGLEHAFALRRPLNEPPIVRSFSQPVDDSSRGTHDTFRFRQRFRTAGAAHEA